VGASAVQEVARVAVRAAAKNGAQQSWSTTIRLEQAGVHSSVALLHEIALKLPGFNS